MRDSGRSEINVGVMGGATHLSRLLPQPLVRLLHFTGEPPAAEEFVRDGGVLTVVPRDRLLGKA